MLIFLKEQRDEVIDLIINLLKELNENKYEIVLKNNNCFVDEITHV